MNTIITEDLILLSRNVSLFLLRVSGYATSVEESKKGSKRRKREKSAPQKWRRKGRRDQTSVERLINLGVCI